MTTRNRLVMLVALARQFRTTPIVDADFTQVRDMFDREMRASEDFLMRTRGTDPNTVHDFFRLFWHEQSAWSQATFGSDNERGPLGAVRHLQKEAKEVEDALGTYVGDALVEEFVDCFFLTLDGARRSGFTDAQFMDAVWAKLKKNKLRQWAKPQPGDQPIEHVPGTHD